MQIKFTVSPHTRGERLYRTATFDFKPGITVLTGSNGAGKTTLLNGISDYLDEHNIPYYRFDNYRDGGPTSLSRSLLIGNMSMLAQLATSSEGERISLNLTQIASAIGRFVRSHVNDKVVWILLDGIDSGLDIAELINLRKDLLSVIVEDTQKRDTEVYIVITANTYELAKDYDCMDVTYGKYRTFDSYESYADYVCRSSSYKYKRYERQESN